MSDLEISSTTWISEWKMGDAPNFTDDFEMNPFDFSFEEFKFEQTGRNDEFYRSPAKPLKAEDGAARCQILAPSKAEYSSSSSSYIINFENSSCKFLITTSLNNQYSSRGSCGLGIKKGSGLVNKNSLHAREHVIAERKRREKLSQRFIALSALIPGLNKIDKASILSGAVRHVKELEERLKVVEEEKALSKMSEEHSAAYVKRTRQGSSSSDDDTSSSDGNSLIPGRPVPEIEVRISNKDVLVRIPNKDVLVRIHCHKRKGCLSFLLGKIENLNLTILNSTALPFSHSKLDITIVAQAGVGFCMTVEDVVKSLRQALLDFS